MIYRDDVFKLDFSGKYVLVTGATGGIGSVLAQDFAALGAHLILTGKRENPEQINQLKLAKHNQEIKYIQVDFTDENSFQVFLNALSCYERIDVCVNNAGTNRILPIYSSKADDYDYLASINLRAPFLICQQVCRKMKEIGYGRIVNIASIWSVITKANRSMYSTTKFGIVGMTKSVAVDMASYSVLANSVSPGFVMTELTRKSLTDDQIVKLAKQVPLGRFAQPEEISKVVLFLASDINTYITGQNIIVDGGFVSV